MVLSFLAGAAAGVAIAYLITSDRGEEIIDEIKTMAGKLKENISSRMNAAMEEMSNMENMAENEGQGEEFMGV